MADPRIMITDGSQLQNQYKKKQLTRHLKQCPQFEVFIVNSSISAGLNLTEATSPPEAHCWLQGLCHKQIP